MVIEISWCNVLILFYNNINTLSSFQVVSLAHCSNICKICTYTAALLANWELKCVFRLDWRVRNQQEAAEQELTERNGFISEITDLGDWLNAANVKVRSAPGVGSRVERKIVQRLISEHKVILSVLYCDFYLHGYNNNSYYNYYCYYYLIYRVC